MKFTQEFKIPLKREILNEVFKKTATLSCEMSYDEFRVIFSVILDCFKHYKL